MVLRKSAPERKDLPWLQDGAAIESAWGTLGVPQTEQLAELLNMVETAVGTLRHAYYSLGAVVPLHRHDVPTLVYGVGGPCVERSRGRQLIKRRLTYHPAGYRHALEYLGPTHVLSMEPSQSLIEKHPGAWPSASAPLVATLYDDVWLMMLRISENALQRDIAAAMEQLWAKALEQLARDRPEWISQVIEILHLEWRTVPSARALASRVGVSPQHLCRAFKRHTGATLQSYALQLRLDYARGLLWGTGLSISQIAAETAFSDQSHLTRVLGWHSDRTPGRLRRVVPFEGRSLKLP